MTMLSRTVPPWSVEYWKSAMWTVGCLPIGPSFSRLRSESSSSALGWSRVATPATTRPAMRIRPRGEREGGGARPLLLLPRELVSGVCHREQLMECPACGAVAVAVAAGARQRAGVAGDAAAAALRARAARRGRPGRAGPPRRTRRAPTRPAPPAAPGWRRRCCGPSTGGAWRCSRTPHGPLLDVGAGRGRFVAYARAHGFPDATGIEPSARSSGAARGRRSRWRTPRTTGSARSRCGTSSSTSRTRRRRCGGCTAGCGRAARCWSASPTSTRARRASAGRAGTTSTCRATARTSPPAG